MDRTVWRDSSFYSYYESTHDESAPLHEAESDLDVEDTDEIRADLTEPPSVPSRSTRSPASTAS